MRALLDVCEQLAESPLDRSRPLWEFTLLDGLSVDDGVIGGRAALLQKVHHTISDGVGGLKLSMALLDTEPDLIAPPEPEDAAAVTLDGSRGPVEVLRSALNDATARNVAALRNVAGGTASALVHPTDPARPRASTPSRVARSLHRQGFVADGAALRPHRGPLAAAPLRGPAHLARLAQTRRERARRQRQRRVRHRRLRRARPLPRALRERRPASYGWRCRSAPAGAATPARTGSRRHGSSCRSSPRTISQPCSPRSTNGSRRTKQEPALAVIEKFAGLAMLLPTSMLVAFTRNQARTIDFAASNLRGSPIPLYLAGARIVASYPFGPRAGTAINVTTLGYADALDIGINVDPAAVEDIDGLMIDFAYRVRGTRRARGLIVSAAPAARASPRHRATRRPAGRASVCAGTGSPDRRRTGAASARRRRGRAARRHAGGARTARAGRRARPRRATRARQSGHADTVAASRSPRSASSAGASGSSNTTSTPSSSMNRSPGVTASR